MRKLYPEKAGFSSDACRSDCYTSQFGKHKQTVSEYKSFSSFSLEKFVLHFMWYHYLLNLWYKQDFFPPYFMFCLIIPLLFIFTSKLTLSALSHWQLFLTKCYMSCLIEPGKRHIALVYVQSKSVSLTQSLSGISDFCQPENTLCH